MKVPMTALCVLTAAAFLAVGACTNGGKNKGGDTTGFTAGSAAGQANPPALPASTAAPAADSSHGTASTKAKKGTP